MDLKITGIDAKNKSYVFEKPIAFYLQSDRFTPADSFEFTAMDNIGTRKMVKLRVRIDGKQIFWGIVDVQKTVVGPAGRYIALVCRSMPCMMLDNEVRPYTYHQLTSQQLIKQHALPYGVSGSRFPYETVLEEIIARKGISYWEFIVFYCKLAYGKTPYLDRNNRITLTPYTGVKHDFSNRSAKKLHYTDAAVCEDRYGMISKLHIKTGKEEFGAAYTHHIINDMACNLGIVRERYYNPSREWEARYSMGGKSLMVDRQLDYLEIQVTVPYFLDAHVGDTASFEEENNLYPRLYVSQVRLLCDESGIQTKLKLWDQAMLIL